MDKPLGKQIVRIESGQFPTGRFDLHEMYNKGLKKKDQVSEYTVWRWLLTLEKGGFVSINSSTKFSIVTIVNWDIYQSDEHLNEQQVSNKRATSEQQVSTNKNVKNVNNDKNDSQLETAVSSDGILITDDTVHEISLALQNAVQAIEDHYITKRASGTMVNADDYKKIMNLVEEGVPVDSIINGIDSAFDNHKPKYPGDKIRSFGYCETVIRELHYNKTQKDERNNERVTKKTLPPFKKNDRREKLPSSVQNQLNGNHQKSMSDEELAIKEERAQELLRALGEID